LIGAAVDVAREFGFRSESVRDPLVTGRATDDIQIMRAFSMAQLVSIAAKSVHADSPVDTSNE